jgi:anti-sigma factor RsiW
MTVDLPCNRAVELVTDYLERALPPAEALAFEEHLLVCEGCTEHVQQIRTTVALLGRLPDETPSPAVQAEVVTQFRLQRGS